MGAVKNLALKSLGKGKGQSLIAQNWWQVSIARSWYTCKTIKLGNLADFTPGRNVFTLTI